MIKNLINFIGIAFLFTACSNKNIETVISHNLEKEESIYSLKQAKK